MINISKPTINDINILRNCASACDDPLLTHELMSAIPYFTQIYHDYDRLMTASTGYTIPRSLAHGNLNADFMKKLYTKQLVGKKGSCRDDYDRILASAPRKKMPHVLGKHSNSPRPSRAKINLFSLFCFPKKSCTYLLQM